MTLAPGWDPFLHTTGEIKLPQGRLLEGQSHTRSCTDVQGRGLRGRS